jgi:RNA polymerase sigma factor (TIGR02999 family)
MWLAILIRMSDVTRIMSQIELGDPQAAERLLPLLYDELRRLAAFKLSREKPGQTLNATALVHEAYLRLVGSQNGQHWDGRGHFFAAAAEAMRRILLMNARRRSAAKHGGGHQRIELDSAELQGTDRDERLLSLDEALARLEQKHLQKAQLVKLRFFAGLTNAEAATLLGISDTTADRLWAYARAWLKREMAGDDLSSED